MAGLTDNGLTINSLQDQIAQLKAKAQTIFADLVPAGDTVNTSDNTVIGRQIGLVAPSLADLWEAIQQVNDSFNILSATGIALDNLCALGGITRKKPASSVVSLLVTGTPGTLIPVLSQVGSPTTSKNFNLLESVTIDATSCAMVKIDVPTVADATVYTLQFIKVPDTLSQGTFTISITSGTGATKNSILTALKAAIDSSYSTLFSTVIGADGYLQVTMLDVFQKVTFSSSANLSFVKAMKMTSAACTETGPIQAAPNTVTVIKTPVLGWDSVYNPASAVLGQDLETDEALRLRYLTTKGVDGVNSFEAI
ncbi:MAG TPA: hypothetical protein VFM18_23760, partial [Methanosarcina sp.]|nr:hypothetical protein [Methanosarcina sp.]